MDLTVECLSLEQMAVTLGIDIKTIGTHRTNLNRKLGVHSPAEVVRYAYQHGLVGWEKEGE